MSDDVYDWLVIGSGFGGSVSALRLAEKGYRVLVLEAGKRWNPADFPKTNWLLHKSMWFPRLFCHGIMRLNLVDDVLILGGAGVGGGSLVYATTLLIPPPEAFDAGWPRDRDWRSVLAPHYATAQRMLGVATLPRDFPADELLHRTASELGCGDTFERADVGVFFGEEGKTVPDPYFAGEGPERTGCTFCGGCMVGCRDGAKNTLDRNYLWLAEKRGARVVPETLAECIRAVPGGYEVDTIESTRWLLPSRRVFRAERVVVAAGVLGSMRLLMRSKECGALPRISDELGKAVRTNSEAILACTARSDDVDYSKGVAIGSRIYVDAVTHIEAVRYSRGSDALGMLATLLTDGGGRLPRVIRWIGEIVRHPIDFVRTLVPLAWARRTVILLVMQTVDNCIDLAMKRRWWWPFRRSLSSKRSGKHRHIPTFIPAANDFARRLAKLQNGFPQSALNEVFLDVPTTAHILGGCNIGTSPSDGVIDGKHEVFGHPGLHVIDGSSIPGNLGVNPSLTITALAEHAMSQIAEKK